MSRVLVRVLLCSAIGLAACGDDGGSDGGDGEAPDTVLTAQPAALSNQRTAHFEFTATGTVTDFSCALDNGGAGRCASPYDIEVGDGLHTITITAKNSGVADESPVTYSWSVDATPPDTAITSIGPPAFDNSTSVMFAFAGTPATDVDHFQCSLDASPFTDCASGQMYDSLTSGLHTFQVRAVDQAGNLDATPAKRSWTLDTSTPDTTITSGPADGATTGSTVEFGFSSPEATAVFECALDAGNFAACDSPASFTGLGTGSHTFQVRAKNPVSGAFDPTPAMRTFVADGSAPTIVIDTHPTDPTSDNTPTFSFSSPAPDITGYECQINSLPFATCTSPFTAAMLADGLVTFRVRATDSVGNVGTAMFSFTIDTAAPTVAITGGPSGNVSATSGTFTFVTDGTPSAIQCALDAAAFTACSSPAFVSGFSDGMHTFFVKVTDLAGNSSMASRSFTVVTMGPSVTITGGPTGAVSDSTPTFTFTTTNASTIDCRFDGGTFAACTSPFTAPTLSEGEHTLEVRVRDVALNQAVATRTFTVDTVSPTVSIITGPNGPTNTATPTFTFVTGGSPTTTECRFDGAAFAACTSPFTAAPPLSQGSHTLTVRVTDDAANTSADTRTFSVVTTGPTVTFTSGPSGPTNDSTPTFTFTTTNSPSVVTCSVDSGVATACTSPFTTGALADGAHSLTVRVADTAGNANTATRSFTVDTSSPTVAIISGPSGPTNVATPTFGFAPNGATSVMCRFDAGVFVTCTSPYTSPTTLTNGNHTFEVTVADDAGNTGNATRAFTVDTVAPTVSITSPAADGTTTTNPTPTFGFSTSGPATYTQLECFIDTGSAVPCTSASTYTPPPLGGGDHTFRVKVTDAAGNTSSATRTITIDSGAPSVSIQTGPNGACPTGSGVTCNPTNDNTPTFTFTYGATSDTVQCRFDTDAFADCKGAASPGTFTRAAATPLTDAFHSFDVRACNASSICSTDSRFYTVDTLPPTVAITASPPNFTTTSTPTKVNPISFTFAGTLAPVEYLCAVVPGTSAPVFPTDFADCASTTMQTYPGQADGDYTFEVRVRDAAYNYNTTPQRLTYRVDRTVPTFTAVTPPLPQIKDRHPALTFAATTDVNPQTPYIECKVDGGAFAACVPATPLATSGSFNNGGNDLADGTHTYTIRVTDRAGNQTTNPPYSFIVDNVAPTVTIDSTIGAGDGGTGNRAPTNTTLPTFAFSVANTVPVAGTTPSTPLVTTCVFTGPGGYTSTVACSPATADGAGTTTVQPSQTLTTDGTYTLTITSVDAAVPGGNTSATVVGTSTRTFIFDKTMPAIAITDPAANGAYKNTRSPTIQFTASDSPAGLATVQCKLDGAAAFTTCNPATGVTTANLTDGPHTFQLQATDKAGNLAGPITRTFNVDASAPAIAISTSPAGPFNTVTVTTPDFEATLTNTQLNTQSAVTVTCNIDGAATGVDDGSCTVDGQASEVLAGTVAAATIDLRPSASKAASIADGTHTINVRAADLGPNVVVATPRTFTLDRTAPVVTFAGTPGATTTQPAFSFSISDAAFSSGVNTTSILCQVDGGMEAACTMATMTAGSQTVGTLADGPHTYKVRVTDNAGNKAGVSPTFQVTYSFTLDTQPPTLVLTTPPAVVNFINTITIGIDVTDVSAATNGLTCTLDGATVVAAVPARTPPGSTFPLTYTVTDPAAAAHYDCALPANQTTEGLHTVVVTATDAIGGAGHTTTRTRRFYIDNTSPVLSSVGLPATGSVVTTLAASYSFQVRDNLAGTTAPVSPPIPDVTVPNGSVQCTITPPGGSATTVACTPDGIVDTTLRTKGFPTTGMAEGVYTLTISASDSAGNAPTTFSTTFTVDAAPTVTVQPAVVSGDGASVGYKVVDAGSSGAGTSVACTLTPAQPSATISCPSTFTSNANETATVTGLANGTYTLTVTATDGSGNAGSATSPSFSIAVGSPLALTTAPPATGYPLNTYDFAFGGGTFARTAASYECQLDSAAPTSCSGTFHAEVAFGAAHTFGVRTVNGTAHSSWVTKTWTPARGTVLKYGFDTAAPTANSSALGSALDVAFTPATPATTCGAVNDAIPATEFELASGTASTVAALSLNPLSTNLLVGVWVRVHNPAASSSQPLLTTIAAGGTDGFTLSVTRPATGAAQITLAIRDGSTTEVTKSVDLVDNTWTHVAFRATQSSTQLLINGVASGTPLAADPFGPNAVDLVSPPPLAAGKVDLDEVRATNVALPSVTEVCTTLASGTVTGGICTPSTTCSPDKAITAFSFPTTPVSTGTIDEAAKTIAVTLPAGTTVTALVASFTTTGASVKVGATPQVSGTTANDLTTSKQYVVTAADSTTTTYTVTVSYPSIVLRFPLDGNAQDVSGNGLNGTVTGFSAATDRASNPSGAMASGTLTGQIDVPALPSLGRTFSVSMWVKVSDITKGGGLAGMQGGFGSNAFAIIHSTNRDADGTFLGDEFDFNFGANGTSIPGFKANEWHHLGLVSNGVTGTFAVYFDGIVVRSDPVPSAFVDAGAVKWWVGNAYDGSLGFLGALDDVRIFSKALSASEMAVLATP